MSQYLSKNICKCINITIFVHGQCDIYFKSCMNNDFSSACSEFPWEQNDCTSMTGGKKSNFLAPWVVLNPCLSDYESKVIIGNKSGTTMNIVLLGSWKEAVWWKQTL